MLDTNICIFVIKNKPESVIQKFMNNKPEDICISFDALAAQFYGAVKADLQKRGLSIGPMDALIAAHAKALGSYIGYK